MKKATTTPVQTNVETTNVETTNNQPKFSNAELAKQEAEKKAMENYLKQKRKNEQVKVTAETTTKNEETMKTEVTTTTEKTTAPAPKAKVKKEKTEAPKAEVTTTPENTTTEAPKAEKKKKEIVSEKSIKFGEVVINLGDVVTIGKRKIYDVVITRITKNKWVYFTNVKGVGGDRHRIAKFMKRYNNHVQPQPTPTQTA